MYFPVETCWVGITIICEPSLVARQTNLGYTRGYVEVPRWNRTVKDFAFESYRNNERPLVVLSLTACKLLSCLLVSNKIELNHYLYLLLLRFSFSQNQVHTRDSRTTRSGRYYKSCFTDDKHSVWTVNESLEQNWSIAKTQDNWFQLFRGNLNWLFKPRECLWTRTGQLSTEPCPVLWPVMKADPSLTLTALTWDSFTDSFLVGLLWLERTFCNPIFSKLLKIKKKLILQKIWTNFSRPMCGKLFDFKIASMF